MNFRKMITLIEILALTGVMSVGFSTWVIIETEFPYIQVQVETENVFNTNDYLEIKNIAFSDYNENGFYDDFTYVEDTTGNLIGYLEFEIEVDLSKCGIFNGNLKFDISVDSYVNGLSNDSNNLFLNSCKSAFRSNTSSYLITDGNSENKKINELDVSISPINGKFTDTIKITTTNVTDSLILTFKYGFSFEKMEDFINCTIDFYDKVPVGVPFHISVMLGGGN